MTIIEARLKRWGNSFGVVVPIWVVEGERMKENEKIKLIVLKDSRKILRATFGILKGRFKKTAQEMKNELRRELYNE